MTNKQNKFLRKSIIPIEINSIFMYVFLFTQKCIDCVVGLD